MKWRVKKKQLKRYERKNHAILLMVKCPVIITKRRKTILRLHNVKPWMLNEVIIRYTTADHPDPYAYTSYHPYTFTSFLEKGGTPL